MAGSRDVPPARTTGHFCEPPQSSAALSPALNSFPRAPRSPCLWGQVKVAHPQAPPAPHTPANDQITPQGAGLQAKLYWQCPGDRSRGAPERGQHCWRRGRLPTGGVAGGVQRRRLPPGWEAQWVERCTCSRDETTLPSWTSSRMVRTCRLVTEAGVGGGAQASVSPTGGPYPPTYWAGQGGTYLPGWAGMPGRKTGWPGCGRGGSWGGQLRGTRTPRQPCWEGCLLGNPQSGEKLRERESSRGVRGQGEGRTSPAQPCGAVANQGLQGAAEPRVSVSCRAHPDTQARRRAAATWMHARAQRGTSRVREHNQPLLSPETCPVHTHCTSRPPGSHPRDASVPTVTRAKHQVTSPSRRRRVLPPPHTGM